MQAIIRHLESAREDSLILLERMSEMHPVVTFVSLSLMLPVALLGAVAGGVVIIALPFCLI